MTSSRIARRTSRCSGACLAAFAVVVMQLVLLSAHERKAIGQFHLVIGWGDEPAFAGLKNSVEVDVSDAAGMPVSDIGGSLGVEVSFGEARLAAPLVPVRDRPGKFRAWLVPTRPGTYAFHITGTVKGQSIDTTATCSSKTFACVEDMSQIQFPARDPSVGQLAERVARSVPRAERATETAINARNVAIAAIVVAMLAAAAAIRVRLRHSSRDP